MQRPKNRLLLAIERLIPQPSVLTDREQMKRFIAVRISPKGERVMLSSAGDDGDEIYVDLYRCHEDGTDDWDLEFESNEPDWVDLRVIYDHFRRKDMTTLEWRRDFSFVDPVHEYSRKIESLSVTEQEILNAVSETEPASAKQICHKAGPLNKSTGHTRGILSTLAKLNLITHVNDGYLRRRAPRRTK